MIDLRSDLAKIVGSENIIDDPSMLELFAKDESFCDPMRPQLVIKVNHADEVQKIVRLANLNHVPLVPVSSGPPHHKGDTVPSVPGAVVLDMSGMKRILNINRQHRICIVEPGVTYGELQLALAKEGMTISASLAPKATKSVVASLLEAEPRMNAMSQWEFFDPLRCMEVIWGDGNRMYTGEAAQGPLDLEKQWASDKHQVIGSGPFSTDFLRMLTMAQGTMGIVTWASVKCELLPTVQRLHMVPASSAEELKEFLRKVVRLRFSDIQMIMNRAYLSSLMGENTEEITTLREELPPWISLVGVAGRELLPEERVLSQELDISDIAHENGLTMVPAIGNLSGDMVLNRINRNSDGRYWKDRFKGAFEDIFFLTVLDRMDEFIGKAAGLAEQNGYPAADVGMYIQPKHRGSSYHVELHYPYNPDDKQERELVRKLYKETSRELSDMGAFFSRPYGIWAGLQLGRDQASARIIKELKGIFDPGNIMNPGKITV